MLWLVVMLSQRVSMTSSDAMRPIPQIRAFRNVTQDVTVIRWTLAATTTAASLMSRVPRFAARMTHLEMLVVLPVSMRGQHIDMIIVAHISIGCAVACPIKKRCWVERAMLSVSRSGVRRGLWSHSFSRHIWSLNLYRTSTLLVEFPCYDPCCERLTWDTHSSKQTSLRSC
jgi:hypothetical protein